MVIGVVAIVAGLLAAIAAIATVRWPSAGPAAPHLTNEAVVSEVVRHRGIRRVLHGGVNPVAATGLALSLAVAIAFISVTVIGLLLVMVQSHTGLEHYDAAFARWGANHASRNATQLLRDISQLGGTAVIVALAICVAIGEYVRSRRGTVVAFLALVVGGEFLVLNVIKWAVNRPRPAIAQLTGFSGSSFPSGHATTAAACYTAFALVLGRHRGRNVRVALAASCGAIIGAVAATRVLLGVHWFTDVVAGTFTGWGWFAICSIAFGGRILRFGEPVEEAERFIESRETANRHP